MRLAGLPRVGIAAAAVLAAGLAVPAVATAAPPQTRAVAYHGYRIDVPTSWRVVDLAKDPAACVRFDQPALYLGHPGDQSRCPVRAVGRTAGIVVEPLDAVGVERAGRDTVVVPRGEAAAPRTTPSANGQLQVAVEDAGVLVTGAYAGDAELLVRSIMEGARLVAGGQPATLPADRGAVSTTAVAPQPGTFLGKGFDACTAPSQATMDRWLASPYRAVGVYISGISRACGQPNLTASWVSTQVGNGWHLIPIEVGYQAPCTNFRNRMSSNPATARSQGSDAATASVAAAQGLGLPPGSALYNDIEGYTSGTTCTAAVLSYLSGWTETLHRHGYLSGFYSSAASGIRDAANAYNDPTYTRVDHIWFAWWNGVANTDTGPYAPASTWPNHQRIHQYAGGVNESWGGTTLNIDRNYLDVAEGTPEPPSACTTVNLNFTSYPQLASGASGPAVTAAQCLLENAGHKPGAGDPSGTFDAGTVAATQAFQQARSLPVTGVVDSHTWTALLSFGDTPTLRNGSTGAAVMRLQRALTAALNRTVGIDGQFGPLTEQAVRDYQSSRGLSADGIVGAQTWGALQAGR